MRKKESSVAWYWSANLPPRHPGRRLARMLRLSEPAIARAKANKRVIDPRLRRRAALLKQVEMEQTI